MQYLHAAIKYACQNIATGFPAENKNLYPPQYVEAKLFPKASCNVTERKGHIG
jgi:hypothetical protein